MKTRKILICFLLLSFSISCFSKNNKIVAIGFYNLENLFDTYHDEGKNDYDFLPGGKFSWDNTKYLSKLKNMAQALSDMGTEKAGKNGCALIGLAEVENSRTLDDLLEQQALKNRKYKYIHIEGEDKRGIDCALLYDPKTFKVENAKLLPYTNILEKDSDFFTRGFLTVKGYLEGEPLTLIVCHWPSRASDSSYRDRAALQVKNIKDSILVETPKMKVIVMGDMNDDPTNASMESVLSAKAEITEVESGDMYNPWYNILVKDNIGTLYYRGSWNLFDQIVLSPNFLDSGNYQDDTLKFWTNQIERKDYLLEADGEYKGAPKRTFVGERWDNGYSDHLPVVVYLTKGK